MGILKRVSTGISIVTLAACCGLFLLFGITGTGWKALSVPTGSMRPTMAPGTLAFVHRVPTSDLKIGDVITYVNPLSPKTTVTHRIVDTTVVDGRVPGFITQGDANPSRDTPVPAGAVVGKVVGHLPWVGGLLLGSKTWVGLALLVYLPALLIIGGETQRLASYWRKMKRYQLFGATIHERTPESQVKPKLALASGLTALLLVGFGAIGWQSASAMIVSNQVSLTPNILAFSATPPDTGGGNDVSCTNNTTVNVGNNSSQTATTGNATTNNNTTGGSATTGNATNSNTTNSNVVIQNGC